MFNTSRRYVNPLVWAVAGWLAAVLGNLITHSLANHHWAIAVHIDEVFIGLVFGTMRWLRGEWRIERLYASREAEMKVRDALTILILSENSNDRAKAAKAVLATLEAGQPIRPSDKQ